MGNRRLYKIEHFHALGTSESERLKVTALPSPERLRAGRSKSFSPDRLSPSSERSVSLCCDTASCWRDRRSGGWKQNDPHSEHDYGDRKFYLKLKDKGLYLR